LRIEMLEPAQVEQLWPQLQPLYESACESHSIARDEMDSGVIYQLAMEGQCAIFAMYGDDKLTTTMAIQFHETNGRMGADIIALAGKHILLFRKAYWDIIVQWLKANGVEFLDAYVPEERAAVYQKKFGFDKSCAHVRMNL
jgi:hypothetical protein